MPGPKAKQCAAWVTSKNWYGRDVMVSGWPRRAMRTSTLPGPYVWKEGVTTSISRADVAVPVASTNRLPMTYRTVALAPVSKPMPSTTIFCPPVMGPMVGRTPSTAYGGPMMLATGSAQASLNHRLAHPPKEMMRLLTGSYTRLASARALGKLPTPLAVAVAVRSVQRMEPVSSTAMSPRYPPLSLLVLPSPSPDSVEGAPEPPNTNICQWGTACTHSDAWFHRYGPNLASATARGHSRERCGSTVHHDTRASTWQHRRGPHTRAERRALAAAITHTCSTAPRPLQPPASPVLHAMRSVSSMWRSLNWAVPDQPPNTSMLCSHWHAECPDRASGAVPVMVAGSVWVQVMVGMCRRYTSLKSRRWYPTPPYPPNTYRCSPISTAEWAPRGVGASGLPSTTMGSSHEEPTSPNMPAGDGGGGWDEWSSGEHAML